MTQRYLRDHFGYSTPGRYIALVGDAEIDEGNVPEALGEASAYGLSDLWWIVDINRQSLDHIAPEGQVVQIARMFEAKGWRWSGSNTAASSAPFSNVRTATGSGSGLMIVPMLSTRAC